LQFEEQPVVSLNYGACDMEDCRALFAVLKSGASPQEKVDAGARLKAVFQKLPADAKAALVAGDACLPALLHVIDGGLHAAWVGACGALLADIPLSSKSAFLRTQPQLVSALTVCLESEGSHSCWRDAMALLKRLVYQEPSLSHINLSTLDFLKRGSGFHAALERCSRGFSSDADNKLFESACRASVPLSLTSSNPPFVAVSHEIVALYVAASRLCSHDPALRSFGTVMSNLSENVAYCSVLGQVKLHEYALSKITGVSAADKMWTDAYSVATRCLSTILNMSRNEALQVELKQSGVIEILAPLADAKCAAQLRVLMAMSYLIGCKESSANSGGALAQVANSSSIGKIVDCLENTLNLKGGPGYSFGSVVLPAILQV
jgi:hypothetical protein